MSTDTPNQRPESSITNPSREPRTLSDGGFSGDTEIITTEGPIKIPDLTPGDLVYTFDPVTELVKLKPVIETQHLSTADELVALETRRCNFRLRPDHRLACRTEGGTDICVEPVTELANREYYKFVNEWRLTPRNPLCEVDITDLTTEYEACVSTEAHGHTVRANLPEGCEPVRRNSHMGYYFDSTTFKRYQSELEAIGDEVSIHAGPNHHRRPYRFDGEDFIRFLGWYVTEGSTTWSRSSDTAEVSIAQDDPTHRQSIQSLLERMGLLGHSSHKSLGFSSKIYGRLLEKLCGTGSHEKRLPDFVWMLAREQQEILMEVLLNGDGNESGTYYTASETLAGDVLRLCLEIGIKPRYTHRRGCWQIYVNDVKDGFRYSQHVRSVQETADLYRLTVADYSTVMAGRNGKFQWVGVSAVA